MNNININGCNLAYLTIGSGEKKILFLHGNGEDHKIFAKMLNKFEPTKYTAYLVDSRCHGDSDCKGEMSIIQFADDMLEFIDKLNLGIVNVVGFSDGANVAMAMASKKQEVIERMVLISGNFNADAIHYQEKLRIKLVYIITSLGLLNAKIRRLHKLQKLMIVDFGINEDELGKIKVPTLVIGAENDVINKNHTELIAKSLVDGIVIFTPKTTHYNIVENEHTALEVKKFIM
ncbi:MAG: alpha/beta hydrolase [Clostridia bacterium]